jgi:hypothetical protein
LDEEEGEAGGVVEGEGGSDPFGEVEEFGCGYADGEGGELVEDGPDDDWDVAEGLALLLVCASPKTSCDRFLTTRGPTCNAIDLI